jgi:ABC-2 type transport system permease protein
MSPAALETGATAGAPLAPTAPFVWSVRRELWEHRSIFMAPLVVAGVMLLGFLVGMVDLPRSHRAFMALSPARQSMDIALPYDGGAAALVLTYLVVGAFYCLAALNGERRDRTILFWKSLPVSDLTTVLSKAAIPLLVLPAITFVVILAAQLSTLLLNSAGLLVIGYSPGILWARLPLATMAVTMLYAMATVTLWYAPVWGWLLLVSSWARRAAFLWAVGVPLGLCLFEKIAFGGSHLFSLLVHRLGGGGDNAFDIRPHEVFGADLSQLDPGKFLADPGLWVGLIVAAAFLAAAVRMRRRQGPI